MNPNATETHRERSARPGLALALLVPAPTLGVLATLGEGSGLAGQIAWGVSKVWLFAFPFVWWVRVEQRRRQAPAASRGRSIAFGLGLGLAISAVVFGAYFLVGRDWIDVEHARELASKNGLDRWPVYLAFLLYTSLVNALLEEYVWRWFCFRQWERIAGTVPAVFLSAACFTLHHVVALLAYFDARVALLGSAGVFAGGLVWSWCYARFRSVLPGYVSHVLVDVALGVIGAWILLG